MVITVGCTRADAIPRRAASAARPVADRNRRSRAGDTTARVTRKAPASLDGGTLTGYTATVTPGGAACSTTATACTITGLADGTVYQVRVVAHASVGDGVPARPRR
jgi:hypothetical protein